MTTYTVREWRGGKLGQVYKPFKQLKRAKDQAVRAYKNMLIDKVDILTEEFVDDDHYSESVSQKVLNVAVNPR